MIKKWTLTNFKSVQHADLPLSPLTIFAGANSSGKSTFLQSILLIAQTLGSQVGSQTVLLNGHLAKLGQFDDLKTASSESESIRIAWELSVENVASEPASYPLWRSPRLDSVSCDITFGVPKTSQSRILQLNPKLFRSVLSCTLRPTEGEAIRQSRFVNLVLRQTTPAEESDSESEKSRRVSPWSFEFDIEFDDASSEELREDVSTPKIIGCNLQHFMPPWLIVNFDQKIEIIKVLTGAFLDPLRFRAPRFLDSTSIRLSADITSFLNMHSAQFGRPSLEPSGDKDSSNTLAETVDWLRRTPAKNRTKVQALSKEFGELAKKSLPEKRDLTSIEVPASFREAIDRLVTFFTSAMTA